MILIKWIVTIVIIFETLFAFNAIRNKLSLIGFMLEVIIEFMILIIMWVILN